MHQMRWEDDHEWHLEGGCYSLFQGMMLAFTWWERKIAKTTFMILVKHVIFHQSPLTDQENMAVNLYSGGTW